MNWEYALASGELKLWEPPEWIVAEGNSTLRYHHDPRPYTNEREGADDMLDQMWDSIAEGTLAGNVVFYSPDDVLGE